MNEFFSKKTLYFVLACCALGGIYGFVSAYTAARNPVKMRADALSFGTKACVAKARQTLVAGQSVPAPVIQAYCDCAVKRTMDATTDEQLKEIGRGETQAVTVLGQPRYTAIIEACQAEAATGLPLK